jgi:hypothetical protein
MLFVLPGMGADHRMYPAPWPTLPDSTFVDWPKFHGEETLQDLAVRALCQAVFRWDGPRNYSSHVWRIHGRKDQVIPLPSEVDLVLDGGHLIAQSRARECVNFIRSKYAPQGTG